MRLAIGKIRPITDTQVRQLSGKQAGSMEFRNVPFAVVQGVCKYVGDKVGNRPIGVSQT